MGGRELEIWTPEGGGGREPGLLGLSEVAAGNRDFWSEGGGSCLLVLVGSAWLGPFTPFFPFPHLGAKAGSHSRYVR